MARNKIRGKAGVKFKSPYTTSKRKSQLRTLVTHLIIHEKVEVTETTAISLVALADNMVTLAKKGDLHSRRQAAAVVRNMYVDTKNETTALQKLFNELGPRYASPRWLVIQELLKLLTAVAIMHLCVIVQFIK